MNKILMVVFLGFFLKIIVALLFLLLGAAAACALAQAFPRIPWTSPRTLVFVTCFIGYFLIHFLLYKPILSHVMAHELTHALAAMVMGGKVTSIHASTTGGTTVTNKSHVFISLAPYIFPLYTAITLFLTAIAAPGLKILFIGLTGFTYAFHLALTVYSLSHHQPDLKEGGVVFSLILILAGNMIVLLLLFSLVWPETLGLSQALTLTFDWGRRLAQEFFSLIHTHLFRPEGRAA